MSKATRLRHYYCFSFVGVSLDTDGDSHAATYYGMDEKNKITIPLIEGLKTEAGLTKSAVLIGISYLGQMTSDEVIFNQLSA
tara:strand:- start:8643 stop:8888 length:246 start_codon:yes stop_codon:yes gene_type:complete